MFGDATYDLNQRRNTKSKKPAQLPLEDDIELIRHHILGVLARYEHDKFHLFDVHSFVELRDCACTRLTLFNGRRGGEPARLLLTEWEDAESDVWLDKQHMQEFQEELKEQIKITYQSGKGVNHLVPVLIPKDTVYALKMLADPRIRLDAGVKESNAYLFPSCQQSEKHCSGWHSLTNVCDKLPVKDKSRLTGTSNRHRLSTLIAALNLTDFERDLAYKHFGHSKEMNETVYQAPAAHMQIMSTGKHLLDIDKSKYKFLS